MSTAPFSLQLSGITKSFGLVEVLHGIDLTISSGQVVAILGENGAGKSTLVKVIAGDHAPTSGELVIDGQKYSGMDPITARRLGISMIYQELADASTLTVAENIALGRWPNRRGVVRWKEIRTNAEQILARLGVDLNPKALVGTLRIGERQIVEIAKALSSSARCLILDEPTAALSATESERLFEFVNNLKAAGVAIIYITHRLDEVKRLADQVVVLRDGRKQVDQPAAEMSRRDMVSAMVGRDLGDVGRPSRATTAGPKVLELKGLTLPRVFSGLDLDVAGGEVVAVYGKLGSGAGEIGEAIFGLHPGITGEMMVEGKARSFTSPAEAIAAGIGYLPADRQREGSFAVLSVMANLCVPSWRRLAKMGVISKSAERTAYGRWHDRLRIKGGSTGEQKITALSGGNQQKVLLGRWLEHHPKLLILLEPTRGVDVGARADIYQVIRLLADEGLAVLVVSSDYEEVVQLADRAVVIRDGSVAARLTDSAISTQELLTAAGG